MTREIESGKDWINELQSLCKCIDNSLSITEGFVKGYSNPSFKAVSELHHELLTIKEISSNLRWYFCSNYIEKWIKGQPLTREEFYLLAAQGILSIPSKTGLKEAYEEYHNYLYKDDEIRGYINSNEKPDPPPVKTATGHSQKSHIRISIIPEEVRTSFLRPDQKKFFKEFQPDLFSRFRKD